MTDAGIYVGGGQGMHTLRVHPSYKASEYADSYHNIQNTNAYEGANKCVPYLSPDHKSLCPLPIFLAKFLFHVAGKDYDIIC